MFIGIFWKKRVNIDKHLFIAEYEGKNKYSKNLQRPLKYTVIYQCDHRSVCIITLLHKKSTARKNNLNKSNSSSGLYSVSAPLLLLDCIIYLGNLRDIYEALTLYQLWASPFNAKTQNLASSSSACSFL